MFGTTPIDEVVVGGDQTAYTFRDNPADASFGFTVEAIKNVDSGPQAPRYAGESTEASGSSGGSVSSGETAPVENQDEPTSDWTNVVWDNQKGGQAPNVNVTWDPMNTYDDDGQPHSYVGDYENDQTVTLTVSNLPRHTWAKVGGYITATGLANDDLDPYFVVTVNGDNMQTLQVNDHPTWSGGPSWITGVWGFSPGENTGGGADAFKHDSKTLTITITAHGLYDQTYNSWRWTPDVYADVYLPVVSLSGDGTVVEDGTGRATFTAHRTGSGTVIGEPLVVALKDAGTGLDGAATEGTDYQPITQIVIPTGQNDGSVDVVPINDDEAEGVESIYKSVAAKPVYLLAEAPATAPATNATTQKANIDDDIHVKSITVYRSAPFENTGSHNDAFGFNFWDTVEIHGEHLDKVLVQQMIKSSTQLKDWNGQNLTRDQVLQAYSTSDMAAVDSDDSFVLDTGWSWAHLHVIADTHNGVAKENDNQKHRTQTKSVTVPNGIVDIGMVMTVKRAFQIWTVTDLFSPLLDVDWGYTWTNSSAMWPAADNPPEPSCVSTDFGTGVFSDVKTITGIPW